MDFTNATPRHSDTSNANSINALRSLIDGCEPGPLMVHSDVFKAAPFVGEFQGKRKYLQDHSDVLQDVAAGRPIWMPTFNYDFTQSGVYDVTKSPSKVGALTEYFRRNVAKWRIPVPVFSYCGNGQEPDLKVISDLSNSDTNQSGEKRSLIKPFGKQSIFANLVKQRGSLLFYGADFTVVTFIHYIEELGQTLYRYDKRFPGTVVDSEGQHHAVTADFHVRPLGETLRYGFDRMLSDLIEARIARYLVGTSSVTPDPSNIDRSVIVCDAMRLKDYWLDRLASDPFYMLHESCKSRFIESYKALGRRARLDDFESRPAKQTA